MSKLQDLRRLKNLTQYEFSKRSNVSLRYIQDLEQERFPIDNVHMQTLVRFGQVLGVPFVVLLDDEMLAREVVQQCAAVRSLGPGPAEQ